MNKNKCKKYLRKAYKKVIAHNKSITPKNIEDEMKSVIAEDGLKYIAFAKIAVYNMQNCANDVIKIEDLVAEIDCLTRIYSEYHAIEKAKSL